MFAKVSLKFYWDLELELYIKRYLSYFVNNARNKLIRFEPYNSAI